jgi:predicted kinase
MNKIFALCGKPGSGKSYIANKIAKHYKSIMFSADKIMLKLFGEINGREVFDNKLKLCKEMIYEITDSILENTQANIIFDFGFWTKMERKNIKERFKDYNVIFVYIKTADDIRWERVENRNNEGGINNYNFDRETFEFLSKIFEEFSDDEEYIIFENMKKLIVEIRKE